MAQRENLYFIAILPPQQVSEEITFFKKDFAGRFNSKAALKVMPHITLKAPFRLPAFYHDEILEWFGQMPVTIAAFHQELKDFGSFQKKKNPVVFVNPLMNDFLRELQKQVLQHFRAAFPSVVVMDPDFRFKPHMTVAYRDLEPDMFQEAWKEYKSKEYYAVFEVKDFHLLQHNGRMWNTISTYLLRENS